MRGSGTRSGDDTTRWHPIAESEPGLDAQGLLAFACMVTEEQWPLGYDPSWLRVKMHPAARAMLTMDLSQEHFIALTHHDLLGPLRVHLDTTMDRDRVVAERRDR